MKKNKGFTLMEILIVILLLGILSGLVMNTFINTLKKGRDSRRKQDLGQISRALEIYYSEHNVYPTHKAGSDTLPWELSLPHPTDITKFYMKIIPNDPQADSGLTYYYESSGTYYRLFSCLENSDDLSYNEYDYTGTDCGSCSGDRCHYGVSSPNCGDISNSNCTSD